MEKPFEVGELVWYWDAYSRAGWYQIKKVDGDQVWFDSECSGRIYAAAENFTRNPVIPPKPKKIVTKKANYYPCQPTLFSGTVGARHYEFFVPPNATNIKPPTYDIEE